MRILVIIVTYNAMQWAERCFASLKNSTVRPDIFVVDNGSTDGTQAFIKAHYPEVMFHQSEENLGFGKANNMGLQYALDHNYDYVYLLNQDAWVMDDTFERLIEISKKYPEYGILSPFQMNADMKHIDRNFVVNVLKWESNPDMCSIMYSQDFDDVYPVTEVMAAHWFMTRDCLCRVGGFSPSFRHYGEDGNYTDRVYYWGLKVGVVPAQKVVHDRGNREDNIENKMYLEYSNSIKALSKPEVNYMKTLVFITCRIIILLFYFKSIVSLKYVYKIFVQYNKIKSNRLISVNSACAFLKLNEI